MIEREVGTKRLATAIGSASSAIAMWRAGNNLPRTDTAARLADALHWPRLVAIAREGRSGTCERCGRAFVNEGGGPKRYCSRDCVEVAALLRARPAAGLLADVLADELTRVHGTAQSLRRKPLTAALDQYRASDAHRQTRLDRSSRQLDSVRAAIDAMCNDCEPAGVCRTADCPLRTVSPLPLALSPDKQATEILPAEGAWGPSHREDQLVAIRAANAKRWGRPGERERAGARSTRYWASMSEDERKAAGAAISVARRAVS